MPDIAMCGKKLCTKCMLCYRYTAIPDPSGWQTWGKWPEKDDECKHFWPNDEYLISEAVARIISNGYKT